MDDVVQSAMDAIGAQDWARLKFMLHPYLHWDVAGVQLRGRTNVMAHLASHPPATAPSSYELRDGQIYRWTGD